VKVSRTLTPPFSTRVTPPQLYILNPRFVLRLILFSSSERSDWVLRLRFTVEQNPPAVYSFVEYWILYVFPRVVLFPDVNVRAEKKLRAAAWTMPKNVNSLANRPELFILST